MVGIVEAPMLHMAFNLCCPYETNSTEWLKGLHSTRTIIVWYLGSLVSVKPIAPSGQIVCTVEAPMLCGIWVFW